MLHVKVMTSTASNLSEEAILVQKRVHYNHWSDMQDMFRIWCKPGTKPCNCRCHENSEVINVDAKRRGMMRRPSNLWCLSWNRSKKLRAMSKLVMEQDMKNKAIKYLSKIPAGVKEQVNKSVLLASKGGKLVSIIGPWDSLSLIFNQQPINYAWWINNLLYT